MKLSFFKRYNAYNHFFAVIKSCTYKQPFFMKKKTLGCTLIYTVKFSKADRLNVLGINP